MTLELWNTFATFATFVVIAATAVAALVQLRHARGSNQIAALTELLSASSTQELPTREQVVRTEFAERLNDPEFRYQILNPEERTPEYQALMASANSVGNYYENIGLLVKQRLVDRDLALDLWAGNAPTMWDRLARYTAIIRQRDDVSTWENFEYLVVLSQDWSAAHPKGAYPAGARRIALKNEWLEADRQYAASRSSA